MQNKSIGNLHDVWRDDLQLKTTTDFQGQSEVGTIGDVHIDAGSFVLLTLEERDGIFVVYVFFF